MATSRSEGNSVDSGHVVRVYGEFGCRSTTYSDAPGSEVMGRVANFHPARSWHGLWSRSPRLPNALDHHKPCQDRADANTRVPDNQRHEPGHFDRLSQGMTHHRPYHEYTSIGLQSVP